MAEARIENNDIVRTDPDILQSAGRILDVLLCFTKRNPDWSISELAEKLGFHKSVTRRIVITLVSRGFLRQDPIEKRYRLGLVHQHFLGRHAVRRLAVVAKAIGLRLQHGK